MRVRVVRRDGSVVPAARVRLASVVMPESATPYGARRGGLCFPAGVTEVLAALRSVSPVPLGEAVADAEGIAAVRLRDNPSAINVVAEDPASGDRGVVISEGDPTETDLSVTLVPRGRGPHFQAGGATATAFDEERLALVDLPVTASGEVNFGAVQFGLLFLEKPGHEAAAYRFTPETKGTAELGALGGRVRVELAPRLSDARVELTDGCARRHLQASNGLVIADDLPAEGFVTVSLEDSTAAFDDSAAGELKRGQTTHLRLGFEPAAMVRVTVVDEQGTPIPAIAVVTSEASPARFATSDLELKPSPLELRPQPCGRATLKVATQLYSENEQPLVLHEGLNEVTVRLTEEMKQVRVTGRIRHHANRELAWEGANTTRICFDDGSCERGPPGGYVEVSLTEDSLDGPRGSRWGRLQVVSKGPVGQLEGSFDRVRWRLRGWGSDGSVLRVVEISVPGPPVELELIPAPAPE